MFTRRQILKGSKVQRPTTVTKFCNVVKGTFGLDLDPNTYERTYAGSGMRASGAVTWRINTVDGKTHGGCAGMTYLMKHWDKVYLWDGFGYAPYRWIFEVY